ncbi:amidase family protein, partial [Dehalococcoidia bacterium]|nr:amidase family protein [Dehalococcoidia bacterium]
MNDLHYLSLVEASRLIESEQLSSTELVEAHLARIRETDGLLNSFITLLSDESLSQARNASSQIRSGKHEGVLHGIP